MTAGALPNLIVIGAHKCGTSALHYYLDLHPEISMSAPKELDFFIDGAELGAGDGSPAFRLLVKRHPGNWSRGLDWYVQHFTPSAPARGESSPPYAAPWFPGVPERMASVIPDARLILLVRDPIERMLSHWLFYSRLGIEQRAAEESFAGPRNVYLSLSRYHEMLRRYLAHFRGDQILVAAQEDLLLRRRETMRTIYRFAGVAEDFWSPKIERERNITSAIGIGQRFRARLERLPGAGIASRTLPQEAKWAIDRFFESRSSKLRQPPRLDPAVRRRVAQQLSGDAAQLRELTCRDFAGWSV